ncbi:MAG: hypothetical protein H0U49_02770 [Parachlamydiaceae bacterium]|nr:hypothetical protein [Parachlamydiaceae bacterium]
MGIDPIELDWEIKKREQMQVIQKYMEEQDALDENSKTGKMGPHVVKKEPSSLEIPRHLLNGIIKLNRE